MDKIKIVNIKNVVIGIAIIILVALTVVYGISTVYPRPEYEDFCDKDLRAETITSAEGCEGVGGKWSFYGEERPKPIEGSEGWCDRDYKCRQDYEDASELYSRNLFLITLPFGIIIIIVGALVFGLEAVGAGLMGGGLLLYYMELEIIGGIVEIC